MTRPPLVALHGMAQFHGARQGCSACDQLAFCDCGFHSVSPLMEEAYGRIRGLWKLADGTD